MTDAFCVADSSPFIVFERVGQLDLLRALMDRVLIPTAVRREVFGAEVMPEWIEERSLTQPLASRIIASRLGAGEREAIALALEIRPTWLVIDDLAARRLAQSLGIAMVGSLGLLLIAKQKGLIPAVRSLMEAMESDEFHISEHLFAGILSAAGEV